MRNRRGAIVVVTGIFIVALMIMAAITVDASRIFAAKNELQTASDAAALAGAIQLLPPNDSSTAGDTARAYALRNNVEVRTIDSVEVEYGVWSSNDREFIAGGDPKDAVRVTTRHALPLSLARVFGDSTIEVTASAIAWSSGPVQEPECLKPIAVPYSRLLELLGYPIWSDMYLTDDDIRRLREMSVDQRSFGGDLHFHFGNQSHEDRQALRYGEDHFRRDQYFPIDIDSTWDRHDASMLTRPEVSPETFRSYLAGPPDGRCSERVRTGDNVRSQPAQKYRAMRDGLSDICRALGGTLEGTSTFEGTTTLECRSDGSRIDMPLRVMYWAGENPDPQFPTWYFSGQTSNLVSRMAGSFVVQRFDWNSGDDDDNGDSGSHARMWGYLDVQPAFGVVGDTASTLFRPVLVR